jgi:carbonic anhydrase/acetyltransferase-like protein (isoleucine patch superfamily)
MALMKMINKISPKTGKNCWLADNAVLIGDILLIIFINAIKLIV